MVYALVILERAGQTLGGFLPRLGGALLLLVLGLLAARLLARFVTRLLAGAGVDDLSERWGVDALLTRVGLPRPLSRLVGRALRVVVVLTVIFAALSLLGLQFLSDSLNEAVLFLPKLLVAAALLLAGVVIASLVRDRLDRLARQMDFPVPLGQLAQIAIVAVFVITAAAQVAVSTAILMVLVGILVAAAAGTLTLAFGLGGQDVARALSAGRYIRGVLEPGQLIGVGDLRGRIEAVEGPVTVVRLDDGSSARIPNQILLSSVVTVYDTEPGAGAEPSPPPG